MDRTFRWNRGILTLSEAADQTQVGSKAKNLGKLMKAGFRVPKGLVLTEIFFQSKGEQLLIEEESGRLLLETLRRFGFQKVAVRSAALGEDGGERSFAGLFESILNVGKEKYLEAIRSVHLSFFSERVQAYDTQEVLPGVLIQEMIEPEYAGVLFSAHPQDPCRILVEMVSGMGDKLVGGIAAPDSYVFDRESLELEEGGRPPIPLEKLVREGQEIEKIFGTPQDIEWAYRKGKFWFLQVRPITAFSPSLSENQVIARERERLVVKAVRHSLSQPVWAQTEMTEVLPRPSPFSLSLMRDLWLSQGATGLACRRLGLPYSSKVSPNDYIESLFGWTYINLHEEKHLFRKGLGFLNPFSTLRIERVRGTYEKSFFENFLPPFLHFIQNQKEKDLDHLSTEELWQEGRKIYDSFTRDHYVQAEVVNLIAKYNHEVIKKSLRNSPFQVPDLLFNKPISKMGEGIEMLARVAASQVPLQVPLEEYLGEFGHRAICDYEMAEPRFWECPDKLLGLLQALRHGLRSQSASSRDDEILTWNSRHGQLTQRLFLDNWDYLKRYESLKETAKHYLLMEIDLLRRILVKMCERKEIDLFYLTAGEVWGLARREHVEYWRALAEYRHLEREAFEGFSLPQQVGVDELEGFGVHTAEDSVRGEIKGICVSGNQVVRGIARVLRRLEDLAEFQPGEILVAKFTEPSWSPVFKMAGGIVTEIGGLLSHTSILAREYKLMTIVSANKVMERIKTGDEIVLRPDGVVTKEETP